MHLQKIVDVVDARHLLERSSGAHPSEVQSTWPYKKQSNISDFREHDATEITVIPRNLSTKRFSSLLDTVGL